jgi:hypothetical protein
MAIWLRAIGIASISDNCQRCPAIATGQSPRRWSTERSTPYYDKAGFVREGVVRDAVLIDGEYRDAIAMALIRRENAAQR